MSIGDSVNIEVLSLEFNQSRRHLLCCFGNGLEVWLYGSEVEVIKLTHRIYMRDTFNGCLKETISNRDVPWIRDGSECRGKQSNLAFPFFFHIVGCEVRHTKDKIRLSPRYPISWGITIDKASVWVDVIDRYFTIGIVRVKNLFVACPV